jgi:ABC-2 type transport system permease protein
MIWVLIVKLLRDVRVALAVVMLLLFAFQMLWAKVTQRIVGEVLVQLAALRLDLTALRGILFQSSGKIVEALMGGEGVSIERAQDMISIAYVHPLTQTILCIWAVGRAAGAIAGEIDRGTMELLLAQPIRRGQLILAHLAVDVVAIPLLALAMGLGTYTAVNAFGLNQPTPAALYVDVSRFVPALVNVMALVFAVSGLTMMVSAFGRQRGRVLGVAVLVVLVQFLINVIGQLWSPMEPLRPFTVFYYYQPQQIALRDAGVISPASWLRIGTLLAVGAVGYGIGAWHFCRRDLPAPL